MRLSEGPGPLDEQLMAYNLYTGLLLEDSDGGGMPAAARLGLEPPRFCGVCGRRMVVQVEPNGWWARCSRHGVVDSVDLERR